MSTISNRDWQDLLQTKLHRPRVTADLIHRPRLTKLLNDGLDRPLILVAAPAGFGKSTLVSAWLESCDLPNAWISLDEADNDLGAFLAYFLAALQPLFPDALRETRALLAGVGVPTVGVAARSLCNELDLLGRDFVLVLDDYNVIHEPTVHELLGQLVQHPPQGLHLVIPTRQDPPLPLGVLRARNQMAEIRGHDLRFSQSETAAFVEQALGTPLATSDLVALAEKTEGWAAALRFATLTLRYGGAIEGRFGGLQAENHYVLDYLMQEVLMQVRPALRTFLLKTSILDRMCAALCQEVVGPDDPACDAQECLAWLEQAAMFTVAMDSRGEWYRYHHLFQELLRGQLLRETSADEIAALHTRASAWFAGQGLLEEAVQHALLGSDAAAAVRLVAEQRHALMDSELWQLHERLLRMFPADMITQHPDLMLMAARIASLKRSDWAHFTDLLDQAESLLAQTSIHPEYAGYLRGEIDTLRSLFAFETTGDPKSAIAFAQRALATTPRSWYYVRSVAWVYLAVSFQAIGQIEQAYAALAKGEPEDTAGNGAIYARVAGARCFVAWMAGDLPAVAQGAAQIRDVSEAHQLRETLGWTHYLLCTVAYERNDLATAEEHAKALEDMRYVARPMTYLQSAFIYSLVFEARGQSDQAQRKLELAFDFLNETRSEGLLPLAQAFQAELAVRQGNPGAARHWATTIAPFLPLGLRPYFYAPQMTLPKILLTQNTPASLKQAADALSRLHLFVTATHNTHFIIEVLALQALLHNAQGNEQRALELLKQAVTLAEPGDIVRVFVDLGPQLARLFIRLKQTKIAPAYVGQILRAFSKSAYAVLPEYATVQVVVEDELFDPLTERESEILALLAQRLTGKEIARDLVISPLTVKRHASTIYSKLQVNGRHEAVAKAIRLGLL